MNEKKVSRRTVLKTGLSITGGMLVADKLALAAATPKPAKAKSVIQIWMWGGPPHTDTFDPKPESGEDYTGPYKNPIETNVKGIRIGEMLPELAKHADKYSIIRSMTHGVNGHETASYMTQTGRKPGGRDVYPAIGGVVSYFKGYNGGYKGLIPPYIVLTRPQGRFSEAGFLGVKYKPFATGGNPAAPVFLVEGIAAPGITRERQQSRRDLLHKLDPTRSAVEGNAQMQQLKKCEDQAYELILGDAGKVFDPRQETEEVREAYGPNTFGQSCLVARRLVEAGVKYVTVNYGGWDTHKEHFKAMRQKLPQMDQAMAALLQDLHDRGLLESTIVWWIGEFGRTPKIAQESPWNGGRHHFGACFSSVVAGGGFKGGQVLGESDAKGETVKNRPVYPWDLMGTMYELLGIDPNATVPHPSGRQIGITPTEAEGYELGGRVHELV